MPYIRTVKNATQPLSNDWTLSPFHTAVASMTISRTSLIQFRLLEAGPTHYYCVWHTELDTASSDNRIFTYPPFTFRSRGEARFREWKWDARTQSAVREKKTQEQIQDANNDGSWKIVWPIPGRFESWIDSTYFGFRGIITVRNQPKVTDTMTTKNDKWWWPLRSRGPRAFIGNRLWAGDDSGKWFLGRKLIRSLIKRCTANRLISYYSVPQ